jgi:hypothetical protein
MMKMMKNNNCKIDLFFIFSRNIKMATTKDFQKVPDFFMSKDDTKPVNTNPRYPNFFQTHFTAGDIDQFESYRDRSNGSNPSRSVSLDGNIWKTIEKLEDVGGDEKIEKIEKLGEHLDWVKYKSLTTEDIDNTFLYLFEKFKKGIFVKIKDNTLAVFLPFSKHNYINEWGNRMIAPPPSDMIAFLTYASRLQGYTITHHQINKFTHKWYANNCLVRPEFPIGENDRGVSNLKDMLLTLCAEREVPDIELFFNRRDFPLLKRDDTEPYEHIFDSDKFPLLSHRYDKYCPILSMVTTDKNADIPFPTMEDWARVSYQKDRKLFAPDFRTYDDMGKTTPWEKKRPTAVFRGASTGCGVTVETNPRLKLAHMSYTDRGRVEDGISLLDAGITKWNCRPRKIAKNPHLQVIDPGRMGFPLVSFLTPIEQTRYKYIVNVDGHVSAFRLSLELSMGSVVLLQESKYRVWFRKYLKEYVHYIPIKEDLSDLYDKIRWCRSHDAECQQIVKNARHFYDTFLTKKGILDYAQLLFVNIKSMTGTYFYNYDDIRSLIRDKQLSMLAPYISSDEPIDNVPVYPFETRNINSMGGFEIFLDRHAIPYKDLVSKKQLHKSKDSTIHTFQLDKLLIDFKESSRKLERVNEAFVGIYCLNKLLRDIPNFKYTFGLKKKDESETPYTLVSEHIKGVLLSEYIKTCSLGDLVSILKILFLALSVAQERCGFVHNDLTCWNIVVYTLPTVQHFVYSFKDQIFTVDTKIVPVIIDYDKSHVIHDGFFYGPTFKTSTVQDCFCVLIHSVYDFCTSRRLSAHELQVLLYMVNFLSETEFHRMRLTTYPELMEFLTANKKYNEIVYRNKCDLEKFEPFDFLMHFSEITLQSAIGVYQIDGQKVEKPYTYINPLFYYTLIIRDYEKTHRAIYEYLDKVEEQVRDVVISKFSKNFIYYVNATNQIIFAVSNVLAFVNQYKDLIGNDNHFIEARNCRRILTRLADQMHLQYIKLDMASCGHTTETREVKGNPSMLFCAICKKEIPKIKLSSKVTLPPTYNPFFSLAKYTDHTFSVPSIVLSMLQGNVKILNEKYISIWEMIRNILLYKNPYTIPDEADFRKKYGRVLSIMSPLAILNHNACINTLRWSSQQLYKKDLEGLLKLPDPPQKHLRTVQRILALTESY